MENSHVTLQVPQNIIDCFACSDGKYLYSIINWQPEKLIKNISNFASLYQHIVSKNPGYSMIYCGRFREILGCIFGWRHQVHNWDTESLIASETRRKHVWFCNHLRVCLWPGTIRCYHLMVPSHHHTRRWLSADTAMTRNKVCTL